MVCGNGLLVYRGVFRGNVSQEEIGVSMKKNPREWFCKVISDVDGCVDPFEVYQVTFDLIAESKVFDIYVTCACCWFLGIPQGSTSIVVFVSNRYSFLRDI